MRIIQDLHNLILSTSQLIIPLGIKIIQYDPALHTIVKRDFIRVLAFMALCKGTRFGERREWIAACGSDFSETGGSCCACDFTDRVGDFGCEGAGFGVEVEGDGGWG
jgi:hypothetical protein